ncbi:MAG: TetR/AcrR family transcriptional regulator [Myxococcales bacterium]|nr:TetR/AcrR family transcriptional regulator [Myxococcales bacterium]
MKEDDTEDTQLSRPARKRNPEESRRRILDAAERAFSLRGFAGARLRDIAQEAGVHHALVHHYYGDKRGLFEEVVNRGLSRVSAAGLEALADPSDFEKTVRGFIGMLFDFCSNNRSLLRIIEGAFRDSDSVAHEVAERSLSTLAGPLLNALRGRMAQGQQMGAIRTDLPVESLILLGFGTVIYRFVTADNMLVAMGVLEDGPDAVPDLDREREHAVQYILAAMAPR